TVTTLEDTPHTFTAADFSFSDADPGDTLASVRIVTVSALGALTLSGADVNASDVVAAGDIGNLVYTPPENANGPGYTSFTFKVSDGTDESADTYTITINVTAVDDSPTVADGTVTTNEDTPYTFTLADFGYSDVDGDPLDTVLILGPPAVGALALSGDTSFGGRVSRADLEAGLLVYTPAEHGNGTDYARFSFTVRSGSSQAEAAKLMTINVTSVPDPATGRPTIEGRAEVGQTLTADTSDIADGDGLGAFRYQWKRYDATGATFEADLGTDPTYELTLDELEKRLTVEVSFTDGDNNAEGPLVSEVFPDTGTVAPATSTARTPSVGGSSGGGPAVATPSEEDFDWNVKRDIERLADEHERPTGVWSDGETLYVVDNAESGGDRIYAYDLSTGERREALEIVLAGANRFAHGVWSDGDVIWVSDSGADRIFAYRLATGERLEAREFDLHEDNRDPRGIWSDGASMYVLDAVADELFCYSMNPGELLARYRLHSLNGSPRGIWSDGTTIWISDDVSRRLLAYRIVEGELRRQEEQEFSFRSLLKAGNGRPSGIWSDGELVWVADAQDARLYSYNMPDALVARLRDLRLSGVELAGFAPARFRYAEQAPAELELTTVEATPVAAAAAVAIEPADADPETEGHQVALADGLELRVTVTSADGSRAATYVVALSQERANEPPVARPLPAIELSLGGEPRELRLSEWFSDPEGDELSYTVEEEGAAGVVEFALAGERLRLTALAEGAATLLAWASDGRASSEALRIDAVVAPPAATAELRIVARRLANGRVEFGLRTRTGADTWSERLLPRIRFLPEDAQPGRWLVSGTIDGDEQDLAADVRIAARRLADGRVEFGLQVRAADAWGDRLLPRARFLPEGAEPGRWFTSSAVEVDSPEPEPATGSEGHGNAPPSASDGVVTTSEDTAYTFSAADFNYSDPDGDPLASVTIVPPPSGALTLSGTGVRMGDVVARSQIDAGRLVYTPPRDANGEPFTALWFLVNDGAADSAMAYRISIRIAAVNDPATGAPVIEGAARVGQTLAAATSGIADADGLGEFRYQWKRYAADGDRFEADLGTDATYTLTAAELDKRVAVEVEFTDADGGDEGPLASEVFPGVGAIQDNTPPTAADAALRTNENTPLSFTAAHFGFTDADGDPLASVRIATPPDLGRLILSGAGVSANQVVSRAEIDAGALVYSPPSDASGDPYTSFSFTVSDGTDESSATYTITINVTAVPDDARPRPSISGTARVGETLTAEIAAIADAGDPGDIRYRWKRYADDGASFEADLGAGPSYELTASEEGKTVAVEVWFGDGADQRSLVSAPFPASGKVAAALGVVDPQRHCLYGGVSEGFSLVVHAGGGLDELVACAGRRGVAALHVLDHGEWVSHFIGAPAFVNRDFAELFADGLPAGTPLVAEAGPPSARAELASLELSGVDLGAFSPARTEYAGVVADGALQTKVTATPQPSAGAVSIAPADADGDPANGHQVALRADSAISVSVTSADGSRTRVYRVWIASGAEAQAEPTATCLVGEVAAGFSLLVHEGGSVEALADCARSRGVDALWTLVDGEYVGFYVDEPAFLNHDFRDRFPHGLPPGTPLYASSTGPVNAPPTAADGSVTTNGDAAYTFTASDFSYADADGDPLASVTIVTLPAAGALSLSGASLRAGDEAAKAEVDAGLLVYTPPANFGGEDSASFRFRVSDGADQSVVYTMTIGGT
ncbi:MAG: Ig-like domain-containing protein, partial [Chloroflexi bacterium]|nr:Ig-like domain-containing protein [Chloroflexota bacterium]